MSKANVIAVDYSVKPGVVLKTIPTDGYDPKEDAGNSWPDSNLPEIVVRHPRRKGVAKIDLSKIVIWSQQNGADKTPSERAEECLMEVEFEQFTNADLRVMEEALKHHGKIPRHWKKAITYFKGTKLRFFPEGVTVIPYLYFDDFAHRWEYDFARQG